MRRAAVVGVLVVGGFLATQARDARAQTNQIRPRVMVMIDTSGSMTQYVSSGTDSRGDGSSQYVDPVINENYMYRGLTANGSCTAPDSYLGVNSRMYAAKQAMTNVVNGSGDIDWGLMKYVGETSYTDPNNKTTDLTRPSTWMDGYCPVVGGFSSAGSGCTSDNTCGNDNMGLFCIATGAGNKCARDNNLCIARGDFNNIESTIQRNSTCGSRTLPGTYLGTGCNNTDGGGVGTVCGTPQSCNSNADCGGGTCSAPTGKAAKTCTCAPTTNACSTNYTCDTGAGRCVYANSCFGAGGSILFDPATTTDTSKLLQWVDGVEDYTAVTVNGVIMPANPELRPNGNTPLAGAARTATVWYNNTIGNDPVKDCRPYVLVQITDGFDTCDTDTTNGPVAGARSFVAATVAGRASKPLNKVYVIGLNLSSPTLDAIAQAGGTGNARLATSQQDIEAALADIVASSVLVEKCNGIDDNCNGQCDENFPGVAVSATAPDGTSCNNPRPASTCDNGWPQGTSCYATGPFVCSADQLSQQCSAPSCVGSTGATLSSPSSGVLRLTGVSGLSAANIGQLLYVSGASKSGNNGAFVISAVGSNTVDVVDTGVSMPDSNKVAYGLTSLQGTATAAASGSNEVLTVAGGVSNVSVGDSIIVVGGPAADDGTFTVSAVTSTTITFAHAGAVAGSVLFVLPKVCPNVETCNQKDDDCNGIIDDCTPGVAGSCCTSNCPACARAPFIETCNNCDDDCDGIIDNHLVDTGLACGNNVGDCAPGTTQCCSNDPNTATCARDTVNDKLWCQGGNPGYPKPADLCDGTDDNCNGVPNDNPPKVCYTDGSGNPLPGTPGVGVCHNGTQQCLTAPLPAGNGGCPAGWPAGKPCPNPTPSYGTCTGAVGSSAETCNGLDDDCNGCIDNNPTDAWIGTACCSTGNLTDCDNTTSTTPSGTTVTGTRCKRGTWQCAQAGGACTAGVRSCVGSVARSAEVCDTVDNDCDGQVDDVPGLGTPCTDNGVETRGTCRALLECPTGTSPTNPKPPVCTQTVGPSPEICNGLDDNCNGVVDDPPLMAAPGQPAPGSACDVPIPPADKPPCQAGVNTCIAGTIVCVGAVGPMPNQCNGVSTDCTGMPNTSGNCPTGFSCYQGNCVSQCSGGEFPCPGGFVCQKDTNLCVPDVCAQANCPAGDICQVDKAGNAQCIDPCVNITCPDKFICKLGLCVDGTCRTQGCPSGQICVIDTNGPECQPDPCLNVTCDGNQFCENGTCHGTCAGPCPPGQYCNEGNCVDDPCRKVSCLEGQACVPQNGVGVCVTNQCSSGCNPGQACCGGSCIADACENVHCPEDTHCRLNSACAATCETDPAAAKDQIVGAGGGGFGCDVGGGHGTGTTTGAGWLLVFFGVLAWRRRRAGAAEVTR